MPEKRRLGDMVPMREKGTCRLRRSVRNDKGITIEGKKMSHVPGIEGQYAGEEVTYARSGEERCGNSSRKGFWIAQEPSLNGGGRYQGGGGAGERRGKGGWHPSKDQFVKF